jgi:alkanesulfonate monooxygenase SsuD/methylene tetrahydromethanopterin reductase-like flavin-dependent oxidoreductase (luciferase family)
MTMPFEPGSVSLRLYPHNDLSAPEIVEEACTQARLAAEHGFDGVMTSEHHGGFAGYMPNPLQMAGFMLEAMPTGWAAACPLLLPLRPAALVAEEVAWLNARFPGRVGVGVAAGSLPADFEIVHVPMEGLTKRFVAGLDEVVELLNGPTSGVLATDRALMLCRDNPIPVLSAAMGFTAVRRAARLQVGLVFDSLSTPERVRELTDAYRDAGGTRPSVMVRRVWVGPPPKDLLDQQMDVYRGYARTEVMEHWGKDQNVWSDDPTEVAERLAVIAARAGADAINMRIHVPGVMPDDAREQIVRLGDEVIPVLRDTLAAKT